MCIRRPFTNFGSSPRSRTARARRHIHLIHTLGRGFLLARSSCAGGAKSARKSSVNGAMAIVATKHRSVISGSIAALSSSRAGSSKFPQKCECRRLSLSHSGSRQTVARGTLCVTVSKLRGMSIWNKAARHKAASDSSCVFDYARKAGGGCQSCLGPSLLPPSEIIERVKRYLTKCRSQLRAQRDQMQGRKLQRPPALFWPIRIGAHGACSLVFDRQDTDCRMPDAYAKPSTATAAECLSCTRSA